MDKKSMTLIFPKNADDKKTLYILPMEIKNDSDDQN